MSYRWGDSLTGLRITHKRKCFLSFCCWTLTFCWWKHSYKPVVTYWASLTLDHCVLHEKGWWLYKKAQSQWECEWLLQHRKWSSGILIWAPFYLFVHCWQFILSFSLRIVFINLTRRPTSLSEIFFWSTTSGQSFQNKSCTLWRQIPGLHVIYYIIIYVI